MKSYKEYLTESDNNKPADLSKFVRKLNNPETGKAEYAFINIHKNENDPHFVLKWFGDEKPSDEAIEKELHAVEYFKHNG